MHIVTHSLINEINTTAWNKLLTDNNPFMRHEFLNGLEECDCAIAETGWQPAHIAAYTNNLKSELLGVMPCYIKNNSYGEYIFDWSWADAHYRNGLDYYPKLTNAAPFTPATGERWLIAKDNTSYSSEEISTALINAALKFTDEHNFSGLHCLFLNEEQYTFLGEKQFLQRVSNQFHWRNQSYQSFDDFLAKMSSKKRKNIKRERRRVKESNIDYQWLTGSELNLSTANTIHQFYQRTINYYGARPYLNHAFFEYLVEHFSEQTLILFAKFEDKVIAGGLYFKSDDCLYGRYWGALDNFHSVHFETCYYQAIEWCIAHGYARFEAGAQGEHKLARGLEPNTTYSAHWISHPQFRVAIDDFLDQEKQHIAEYSNSLQAHSPFKTDDNEPV